MKALFIGGTGTISLSCVKRLCAMGGWEITLLNRGNRAERLNGVQARLLTADINNEESARAALEGETFDVVCQFVAFTPAQAARDIRLFAGKTKQYVFISSASAYHKPVLSLPITESTPLHNPYWQYSRDKAACEALLLSAYRESGFPATIVRPSHTYAEHSLPLQIHGDKGPWPVLQRMLQGKTVPLCADGMTLWTTTHADDFAVYFCGLLGNPRAVGEAYHITSDQALTWNQMYQTVADILGIPFKPCYVPADILAQSRLYDLRGALLGDKANNAVFDNAKVRAAAGIPAIAFRRYEQGARESIRYLMEHPEARPEDAPFDAFCDRLEALMRAAGAGVNG